MKQRYLVGKMNVSEEEKEEGHCEVTMDGLGEHYNPSDLYFKRTDSNILTRIMHIYGQMLQISPSCHFLLL